MQRPYQFIKWDLNGDVFCVRLQKLRIPDHQLDDSGSGAGSVAG